MYQIDIVRGADSAVAEAMEQELRRQSSHIELIASENFASGPVISAMGTPLTN